MGQKTKAQQQADLASVMELYFAASVAAEDWDDIEMEGDVLGKASGWKQK
jgi:hypothetical protein